MYSHVKDNIVQHSCNCRVVSEESNKGDGTSLLKVRQTGHARHVVSTSALRFAALAKKSPHPKAMVFFKPRPSTRPQ